MFRTNYTTGAKMERTERHETRVWTHALRLTACLALFAVQALAQPGFSLLTPTADGIVTAGQPVNVTWTGGDPSWDVNLVLIDQATFTVVHGFGVAPNTGSRIVTIPNPPPGTGCGSTYRFYIENSPRTTWTYGAVFTLVCPPPPGSTRFYGIGDLPGGPVLSVVNDATKVGGVIHAVGSSAANSQTLCLNPGNPSGCVFQFNNDTPVLWTLDGATATLTPLPTLAPPGFPPTNAISASAITRDGAFIAGQARSNTAAPGQSLAVRVTRDTLTNLNLSAPPFPTQAATTSAFAISEDGSVLYGVVGGPLRAYRYDVNASSSTIIPLVAGGHTGSAPAIRGVSSDGSVMVGTSYVAPFIGTNGQAFRYVHSDPLGAVSAIPLLAGGSWNRALAVSADGNLVLVAGDSTHLPHGEVYLYNATTGATTALGSPNTLWGPTAGGITADGSVVAATFGVATRLGRHAYFRNQHGWFHLMTALASLGVDVWSDGWQAEGMQVTGISPDGTLVYGQGLHYDNLEGFVAEFPSGYLASFNVPPVPPADTSLVGIWIAPGEPGAILYTADGTYYHVDAQPLHPTREHGPGFERGRYSWDAVTGVLTHATLQDTNGTVGFSGGSGTLGFTVQLSGDTLSFGGGPFVLTRISGGPASIVGGWFVGDPTDEDSSSVFAVFPNGTFVLAQDSSSTVNPSGHDGIEAGTYAWETDGRFSYTVTVDTNGAWGLANGAGVSGISTLLLSRDGLRLGAPGDPNSLTRIVDPQAVLPAFIGLPAIVEGTAGVPLALTVNTINTLTVSAGSLPPGLMIDPATGAVTGTPTAMGQSPVQLTATNSFGSITQAMITFRIKAIPVVVLTSDPNPSVAGQAMTLSATLPAGATGSVQFQEGAIVLGNALLNGQTASLAVSSLTAGVHAITAHYSGNADFHPATSNTLSHVVSAPLITGTASVWAWGGNRFGQVGIGNTVNQSTPTQVGNLSGIASMAAGSSAEHSLAVASNGKIWAWGANETFGQLGIGNRMDQSSPVQVNALSGVVSVAAGWLHSLALTGNGEVWASGRNWFGVLGDSNNNNARVPVRVRRLSGVVAVAAGATHSMALTRDGKVSAWGDNRSGQLGPGRPVGGSVDVPIQVGGLSGVVAIAGGTSHSLALTRDGKVWAWGWNGYGQLGNGNINFDETLSSPMQVSGLSGVIAIAAGSVHNLALTGDGKVWTWGHNGSGQLGNGDTISHGTPVQVSGVSGAVAIAAGGLHSLALTHDGTFWVWGDNRYGQLGNGNTTNQHLPVSVNSTQNFGRISAGVFHSLATTAPPVATFDEGATNVSTSFSTVSQPGTVTVTPIDASSAGTIPGGFSLAGLNLAYEISTTATFSGPITICFQLTTVNDPAVFGTLRVLHNVNGLLIDQTVLAGPNAPNFLTRTLCATTSSLSPFVIVMATDLASPQVTLGIASNPMAVNTTTMLTATVDDTATGDNRVALAEYSVDGGGEWTPFSQAYAGSKVDVSASIGPFADADVLNVCVRGTDAVQNATTTCTLLAVYDPSAGFVTGGGWIDSPAGAFADAPTLSGRASFGFVSRYEKGATAPKGDTEFHGAGFAFKSTQHDWLVVSGPKAQYKGSGTVNGAGDYEFLVTVADGDGSGNGGSDLFRIKVWDKTTGTVIYDNVRGVSDNPNDPDWLPQLIGGGSIQIHGTP